MEEFPDWLEKIVDVLLVPVVVVVASDVWLIVGPPEDLVIVVAKVDWYIAEDWFHVEPL
jgi:hypothetical protein